MAIAFRAAGTVVSYVTSAGTLVLVNPAGTLSTDILIASIVQNASSADPTAPSGWTLIKKQTAGASDATYAYWALGSVSSATFSAMGGIDAVGFIVGYSGVDNTTPMDVAAAGQSNTANSTLTAPSITTVTDNAWFVCIFSWNDFTGGHVFSSFLDGTGLTPRQHGSIQNSTDAKSLALDVADGLQTPAGATGTHTTFVSTPNPSEPSDGITLALRPASGPFQPDEDCYLIPVFVKTPTLVRMG
jgi:hypothetical protein